MEIPRDTEIVPYIRVSGTRQNLKRQLAALERDIITYALTEVDRFTDDGYSASLHAVLRRKDGEHQRVRPEFEVLRGKILSGALDNKILWLVEISRLMRNAEELDLRRELRKRNIRVIDSGAQACYDNSNADDRASFTAAVHTAEKEIDTLVRRLSQAAEVSVRDRALFGRVPYGYVRHTTRDEDGEKIRVQTICPTTGPIVAEICTRYAAGEGVTVIAADLNRRGIACPQAEKGRKFGRWNAADISDRATMPCYIAVRRYRGRVEELWGDHPMPWEPIITEELHLKCVERRNGERELPELTRLGGHWLSGIATCGVCPTRPDGGKRAGYIGTRVTNGRMVYTCHGHGHVTLSEDAVDDYVQDFLNSHADEWSDVRKDDHAAYDRAGIEVARWEAAKAELAGVKLDDVRMWAARAKEIEAELRRARAAQELLRQASSVRDLMGGDDVEKFFATCKDNGMRRKVTRRLVRVELTPPLGSVPSDPMRPIADCVHVSFIQD